LPNNPSFTNKATTFLYQQPFLHQQPFLPRIDPGLGSSLDVTRPPGIDLGFESASLDSSLDPTAA
jgi:hypothetical protein